jgi:hypothetical protein
MRSANLLKSTMWIVPLFLLTACATGPIQMGNIWTDPDYSGGGFENILVIGVTPNPDTEMMFESELSSQLVNKGVSSVPRHTVMESGEIEDEESVVTAIANSDLDAVLITHLVAIKKDREFVPGATHAVPRNYYRNYWGNYRATYDVSQDPGYYVEETTVTLETNLYSVAGETLVWTAQSRTFNPEDVKANIEDLSRQVAKELDKQGFLKKSK